MLTHNINCINDLCVSLGLIKGIEDHARHDTIYPTSESMFDFLKSPVYLESCIVNVYS